MVKTVEKALDNFKYYCGQMLKREDKSDMTQMVTNVIRAAGKIIFELPIEEVDKIIKKAKEGL